MTPNPIHSNVLLSGECCVNCIRSRAEATEAKVQAVRSLCDRQSFKVMSEGYCVVMRVVETRDIFHALGEGSK